MEFHLRNRYLFKSYSQFAVNVNCQPPPHLVRLKIVRTADFHFELPPELIAQEPAARRDASRLLVLERKSGKTEHRRFPDLLDYLNPGDVLVLNNSRVIPARLHGKNPKTGGRLEILLLEENAPNDWWAMMRPGKRAKIGIKIQLLAKSGAAADFFAEVIDVNDEGHRRLHFSGPKNVFDELNALGEMPLPPYIERGTEKAEDRERYQTVYARPAGSVAAPTAGLHFTPELLEKARTLGVKICFVTLHVGAGTFLPVKSESITDHKMHSEFFEIGEETAATVNNAKKTGHRVIAVGTTATRALETVARLNAGRLNVYAGKTNIFIFPPAQFHVVDTLLTNFHLPESTLLMLVSAFAAPGKEWHGRELVLSAYAEAIRERYRFFSYGDAMLIL
jgi:S-adenosylmethionine:tRNA ribosyltransferase-isomerase